MRLLKKKTKTKEEVKPVAAKTTAKNSSEDEIAVAIATAIYLYTESQVYEKQDLRMTIKRINKPYSPWSSKIYMMRKWPR
jgi:glutaconyl-CoA/methylmalonyl-CoA decarboxylase subunit delta